MAAVKAVKTAEQDPKTGQSRPQSGARFPYYDLEDSVKVARTIHEKAGGLCDRSQLAALLGHKGINSGAFLTRLAAARMFGLIETTPDLKFKLTQRGQAIIAPVSELAAERAKIDAFMSVDLFKRIYDQFHGTTLPADVGLKNLFETTYQIVPARSLPTVRIMLSSADFAGLFKTAGSRNRMAMPVTLPGSTGTTAPPQPPTAESKGNGGGNGGGGNGGGDDGLGGIDPAIVGLLRRLPPGGTPMSGKRRKALIEAFTSTISWVYPEADTDE